MRFIAGQKVPVTIRFGVAAAFACCLALPLHAAEKAGAGLPPVLIGFDGAYSQLTNTAARAIELGTQIAMEEINRSGGLFNGRPLALVTKDNHGVAARAKDNFRDLAALPDLVAVYGGKFSPAIMETMPLASEFKRILVSLWGSANPITDDPVKHPFVYRLSLKDAWAIPAMMRHALKVYAATRLCLMVPNTAWGRSGAATLETNLSNTGQSVVYSRWYNWGEKSFDQAIERCHEAKGQAFLVIANEGEGAALVNAMARLEIDLRLPIVAHWGVTGGAFHTLIADSAQRVRLDIIQTFSFVDNERPAAQRLAKQVMQRTGVSSPALIESPVGVAQGYDMTHLVAQAINTAQSVDPAAVQAAMQRLGVYDGAIRRYDRPFTQTNHDALTAAQVVFVNMQPDGALIPIGVPGPRP